MEIEPELWDGWMNEGTPEEKIEKNAKLLRFVRENRRMFATTDEQLENFENQRRIHQYKTAATQD